MRDDSGVRGIVVAGVLAGLAHGAWAAGPEIVLLVGAGQGAWCFDTLGQGTDTVLYARSAQCDPSTELACNDDVAPDLGSRIGVDATDADVFVFVDTKTPLASEVLTVHATPGPCSP